MLQPVELFFSSQKATYLFTQESIPQKGGDKRKFWREILGFKSSEEIRVAILDSITLEDLYYDRTDQWGDRYQAIIFVSGPIGVEKQIRTGWIVRHNENIARFVTAVPQK